MKTVVNINAVELLFENEQTIDTSSLEASMKKHCGAAELAEREREASAWHFFFPDKTVEYAEGKLPAQCLITPPDLKGKARDFSSSLQQTWQWPGAEKAVQKCSTSLLVTDVMASGLDYKVRVELFKGILQATLENVDCVAINWKTTEQFIDPHEFIACQKKSNIQSYLWGFINVRLFNIADSEDIIMDTLGLATLGLPDLQCHFRVLEPNDIARTLWNLAFYIYENGDVIQDGHTVPGVKPEQKWKCQHEMSILEPERVVLDINPGPSYAAGNRE